VPTPGGPLEQMATMIRDYTRRAGRGDAMKLGMTGTRKGMTDAQQRNSQAAHLAFRSELLSHGDCVGADDEAAAIAHGLGVRVVWHPPADEEHRGLLLAAARASTHFDTNAPHPEQSKDVPRSRGG
jgi:hypothetical protein